MIILLKTAITVGLALNKSMSIHSYDICWKEYPQNWEDHGQLINIVNNDNKDVDGTNVNVKNNKIRYTSDGLNPGTTYTFRVICKNGDGVQGKPGPELIIDTDTVSCTHSHKTCVIS